MLAVGTEGHRLLAPQPGHEVLVGPHETVGLHGEDAGAQVVDHLVSAVGLGGDLRVEPDERLAHPRLDHHVAARAGELRGGQVIPAGRQELAAEGVAVAQRLLARERQAGAPPGDRIQDHLLDGVGLGEGHSVTSQ